MCVKLSEFNVLREIEEQLEKVRPSVTKVNLWTILIAPLGFAELEPDAGQFRKAHDSTSKGVWCMIDIECTT